MTQPWATLVAIGAKCIETRSWSTSYRGPIAIHAAKSMPRYALAAFLSEPFYNETLVPAGIYSSSMLPRGAVIATARLVEVCSTTGLADEILRRGYERAFGDYAAGRFAWFIADVEPLDEPIPAKGALGLWEWHEGVLSRAGGRPQERDSLASTTDLSNRRDDDARD